MRITIVLHTSPRVVGGGTKIIYEYANYLSEKGHDIELAYRANEIAAGLPIPEFIRRILTKFTIKNRPKWFELDERIKKYGLFDLNDLTVHDADIIIATEVKTAEPVAKLSKEKGKKFYFIQGFENWTLSDDDVYKTYALGMKNLTVSNWLSELVDEHSAEKSICIPNSINTEIFKVSNPIENRKKHSITFHYRSNPCKGAPYAFETIRILEKKYPDLDVTVVGIEKKPVDLPNSCKYVQQISTKEVAQINNNAAIFLCSSIEEGFGLPGLEAMASGCALVSSDYMGVHEYAKNESTALISPAKDPQAMAKNIEKLFEDDSYRIQLANNAAIAATEHSLQTSAKKFEEALFSK